MSSGKIYAISISEERGTLKKEVPVCRVTPEGLEGDGHAGDWSRQITVLNYESLRKSNEENKLSMGPGDFAENILIEGLDFGEISEGTRIGKPDHPSVVTKTFGVSLLPKEGLFCRVVTPGEIRKGDSVGIVG